MLDNNYSGSSIGNQVLYLEVPTDSLTIMQVNALNDSFFQKHQGDYLYSDHSPKDLWIRFRMKNVTHQPLNPHFYLGINRFIFGQVYVNDSLTPVAQFGNIPLESNKFDWRYLNFSIQFKSLENKQVTLRLRNRNNHLLFPVELYNETDLTSKIIRHMSYLAIYYGVILVLLVFSLLIIIRYRRAEMIFYFLCVLMVTLAQMFREGLILKDLHHYTPELGKKVMATIVNLGQLSNLFFVYYLFQVRRKSKSLRLVITVVILFLIGMIMGTWLTNSVVWISWLNGLVTVLTTLFVLCISVIIFFLDRSGNEKDSYAKLYLIAYSFFFIGVVLTLFMMGGALRHPFFDNWALKIGFLFEVTILSTGFYLRLERLRKQEMFDMKFQFFQTEREKAVLQEKIVRAELKGLLSQMKPHFIFNSLNSIQHFILKEDRKSAHAYISKFSKLMRMNLAISSESLVSLEDDLEALYLYVDLEKRRVKMEIDFEVTCQLEVNQKTVYIPPFLLQPLIENSIWHGFNKDEMDIGKIQLQVIQYSKELEITVTDNGVGVNKVLQNKTDHESKGHNITLNRLRLFETYYTYQSYFQIIDLSENGQRGTQVSFNLPLILQNDSSNNN